MFNLTSRRTVNGITQNFAYNDLRNRQTDMSWSNGADSSHSGYDAAGRLTTASNPNSTVTRTYDAGGRLLTDTQAIVGTATKTVQYGYDVGGDDGRLSGINIGGTFTANVGFSGGSYDARYTYDSMGRLRTIGRFGTENDLQYTYDAASNISQRNTLLNNTFVTYSPDQLNRKTQRAIFIGSTQTWRDDYYYDSMSRIGQTYRWEDNSPDIFGYDGTNQLTAAGYQYQYNGSAWVNPARSVGYTFDHVGNRTEVSDNGAISAYGPNVLNQYSYAGADGVYYDSEHAILTYRGATYGYINDGQLTTVSSNGFSYAIKRDALGRTVSRTLNGLATYYYYDGEKPIVETGGANASNIYGIGIDEIGIRFQSNGAVYYFYQDHEGSITHVLTGNTLVERYRYDVFGKPTIYNGSGTQIGQSAIGNRFMFTGREWNQTFGFYEYRARAYHPDLGRFMSEDPKDFDGGDYNLYRYCHNDPVDCADPMGLLTDNPQQVVAVQSQQNDQNATSAFDKAAMELLQSVGVRADATTVELAKAIRTGLAAEATAAEQAASKDIHQDTNGTFHAQERGSGDYVTKNGNVIPHEMITSNKPSDSQNQYGYLPGPMKNRSDLANDGHIIAGAHDHGPGSRPELERQDVPRANDVAGKGEHPFISAVASTAEQGKTVRYYVPSGNRAERAADRGGRFFSSMDGGITLHFGQ